MRAGETCFTPSPVRACVLPDPDLCQYLVSDLVRGSLLLVLLLSPEFASCRRGFPAGVRTRCCVPAGFGAWATASHICLLLRTGSVQTAARTRGQGVSQTGLASSPTVRLDDFVSFLLKDFILFERGGWGRAERRADLSRP